MSVSRRSAIAPSITPSSRTFTSTRSPRRDLRPCLRRRVGQVVSKAVVVATGISATGGREVLGVDVGDSEAETFCTGFLRSLKARGLAGVCLVISDAHEGLKAAIRKNLQGSSWQRCRVHYVRSLLAPVPKAHQEMVAAAFWSIFTRTLPPISPRTGTR